MPSITWHTGDGETQCEEADSVKILIASLFVNGTKRRKLTDLRGPPQREADQADQKNDRNHVILHFGSAESATDWCDIKFQNQAQGDLFEHHVLAATGKRKFSETPSTATTKYDSESSSANTKHDSVDTKTSSTDARSTASTTPLGGNGKSTSQTKMSDFLLAAKARKTLLTKSACMPAGWADAVRAAVSQAQSSNRFVSPLPGLMDWPSDDLSKPDAVRLLVEVCAAWESADLERKTRPLVQSFFEAQRASDDHIRKQMEEERRALDAKLRTADIQADELQKRNRFLEKEAVALRKRVADMERMDPENSREEIEKLQSELASMRQRLRDVWDGKTTPEKPARSAAAPPRWTPCATAKAIAELEGKPLGQCSAQDHEALKKKLLLKWHPDKQPSQAHMELATKVTQELQNMKAWTT